MIFRVFFHSVSFSLMLLISSAASAFSGTDFPSPPSSGPDLPPFYRISCADNISLRLTGTHQAPSLYVSYKPYNQMLISEVIDGTLYLNVKKEEDNLPISNEAMVISLQTGALKEIAVDGNCRINASNIQTYGIALIGMGKGKICIKGNDVKVSKIIAQHQSFIKVLWAYSPELFLNAFDKSTVKIAGVANEILLRVYGKAKVDAQYLRTCRVNAFAKNKGLAEVLPLCELRAFAEGRGRIDYYTVPRDALLVTQASGNTLWMGYRN